MASSSSSSNPQWIYDVFINFRGEDTRGSFVSHLNDALIREGINTFIDYRLRMGSEVRSELLRAIDGSQISLVVFSKAYTNSSWCLNELVKIMESRRIYGQIVVPIFYNVEPTVVRYQKGAFGEALEALAYRNYFDEEEAMEVLFKWRTALKEAANFSGFDLTNCRNEAELVKDIVVKVLTMLDKTFLSITKFPVGLVSRVKGIISVINGLESKVCLIGIWGMGGSGKTTTAKAVYNNLHREFEHKSFIENIREVCEKDSRGIIGLQKQLLSDILKTKVKIHSNAMGRTMIQKILSPKRALVVLDDVTESEQLQALCENRKWFGQGSVIIITTRDIRLLTELQVDYVKLIQGMDDDESLELFSWHAFRVASPREDFTELSREVVAYCGGLPLALEVIGSFLYERREQEWRSVLSKLKRIPNNQVQEKLRISYDGLRDNTERNIFLDICCFFIGKDRAYVTEILNGCGLYADIGITVLIERSLIKVGKNNKLGMHHLLRDMGREIVRLSSTGEPGERSRLWLREDVLEVLTKNTGTEAIQGLALKFEETNIDWLDAKAFEKMNKLRLLQLDHVLISGDYGYLPWDQLKWVYWKGFPLTYIPRAFCLREVFVIDLKFSKLEIFWKHPQQMKWLKVLNLSHSKYLTNTPDFFNIPNLVKLILKDCPSLLQIHHSIGYLHKLVLINLRDCTSLNNLPKETYMLKSVKTLILSGCWKIDKLEEDIIKMESLTTLMAENTNVKQVPFSLVRSKSIGYVSLCGYEGLSHDVLPPIIRSWMSPTMSPPSWGMTSSLVSIDLQNNNSGELVQMFSSLSELRSLKLLCENLAQLDQFLRVFLRDASVEVQEYSARSYLIGIGSCQEVFKTIDRNRSTLEAFTTNIESRDVLLPGDNYPYWLTYTNEGHSVTFLVPQHSYRHIKGMTLCVVYSSSLENTATKCFRSVLVVNYTKRTIQIYKRETVIHFNDEDWEGLISILGPGDHVEIFLTFGHELTVKTTAVFLIYDESNIGILEGSSQPSLLFSRLKMAPPTPNTNENAFIRFVKKVVSCKCTKMQ